MRIEDYDDEGFVWDCFDGFCPRALRECVRAERERAHQDSPAPTEPNSGGERK